jgi:hypothetical protein
MKASFWGAALLLFYATVAVGQDRAPMAKAELQNS